jgi:hypothetical protein
MMKLIEHIQKMLADYSIKKLLPSNLVSENAEGRDI